MSNEIAIVRFPDGTIKFTGYHGCGSRINPYLVDTIEDVCEDAFGDPEHDSMMDIAHNYYQMEAFRQERAARKYDDITEVDVWTAYGDGIAWKAVASLSAKTVTDRTSDDDCAYEDGIPQWVAELIVPNTRTLSLAVWTGAENRSPLLDIK